jgi:hypothetical protein
LSKSKKNLRCASLWTGPDGIGLREPGGVRREKHVARALAHEDVVPGSGGGGEEERDEWREAGTVGRGRRAFQREEQPYQGVPVIEVEAVVNEGTCREPAAGVACQFPEHRGFPERDQRADGVGGPPPGCDGGVAERGPDEVRDAGCCGRWRHEQVADESVCRIGRGDVLVLADGVVKGQRGLGRAEPGAETAGQGKASLAGERLGAAPEFFQGDAQRVKVRPADFSSASGSMGSYDLAVRLTQNRVASVRTISRAADLADKGSAVRVSSLMRTSR